MKKLIKILSLSLLVIIVGMSFASCGFIFDMVNNVVNSTEEEEEAIDFDEAIALLENEGYHVYYYRKGETVGTYTYDKYSKINASFYPETEWGYSSIAYYIQLCFFDSEEEATSYYEEIQHNWPTNIYSGYNTSNMACGQEGAVVYCGSNETIDLLFGNN